MSDTKRRRYLTGLALLALGAGLVFFGTSSAHATPHSASQTTPARTPCANPAWPSRTIIVPAKVQNYGTMQFPRTLPLEDKEVVLTFDDGPNANTTLSILDTLDAYCVKATFFFTGLRADRYPDLVREAALRGHTIASHSYSHPNNLRRLGWNSAVRQIRRGISSVQAALDGAPETSHMRVAPFFRFPGLNHSRGLLGWLASQEISTFSCDAGSDDWRRISSQAVVYRSLRNLRAKRGGIIIFHDTKTRTATALPAILERLHEEGYRITHMVPGASAQPLTALTTHPGPVQTPSADSPLEPQPGLSLQ